MTDEPVRSWHVGEGRAHYEAGSDPNKVICIWWADRPVTARRTLDGDIERLDLLDGDTLIARWQTLWRRI